MTSSFAVCNNASIRTLTASERKRSGKCIRPCKRRMAALVNQSSQSSGVGVERANGQANRAESYRTWNHRNHRWKYHYTRRPSWRPFDAVYAITRPNRVSHSSSCVRLTAFLAPHFPLLAIVSDILKTWNAPNFPPDKPIPWSLLIMPLKTEHTKSTNH